MVQAILQHWVTVEERPEPASTMRSFRGLERRLCQNCPQRSYRLHRGQVWAKEFNRMESFNEEDGGGIALVYDLDRENEKIEEQAFGS